MDQTERVILDARDSTGAATRTANANLDSVEKSAKKANIEIGKAGQQAGASVVTITDKTKAQIDRVVDGVERKLLALKSPLDRLIAQQDRALKAVAGDPAAINRVTGAFGKLIAAEHQHNDLAAKIGEAIRNPLDAAGSAVTAFAGKLGAVGGPILAVGALIAGVALAGYEAAKSLGEFGIRLNDVQLRTGLTAEQLGKFDFATKAAGTDLTVLDRSMRGLTVAVEDTSSKGEAGRQWLVKWGIDIAAIKSGNADSADTFEKIGAGLAKLPAGVERSKAALDVFKKAGIENIPWLVELNENLKIADQHGLGFKQADIEGFKQMQRETALLGRQWDDLMRALKTPLALGVLGSIEYAIKGIDKMIAGYKVFIALNPFIAAQAAAKIEAPPEEKDPAILAYRAKLAGVNKTATGKENKQVDAALERWGRTKEGLAAALHAAEMNETAALEALRTHDRSQQGQDEGAGKAQIAALQAAASKTADIREQIKLAEEVPAAEKAAHQFLIESQIKEAIGLGKLFGEREKAIEQMGKSKKAIEDIDAAMVNRYEAEVKIEDAQRKTAAAARAVLEVENAIARGRAVVASVKATSGLRQQAIEQVGQIESDALSQQKDRDIRALEALNAQTIGQKIAVEQQKAAIETTYLDKAERLEEAALDRKKDRELLTLKIENDTVLHNDSLYEQQKAAIENNYDLQTNRLRLSQNAQTEAAIQQASIKSAEIVHDHNVALFDRFKRESDSLLDALFTKSRNIFQAIGDSIKNVFLTAFKDIVSSHVAALLTSLVTGQHVGLSKTDQGAGPLGKLASAIGLGSSPIFGKTSSKLEQPGHLGDVALVSGAVPVFMIGSGGRGLSPRNALGPSGGGFAGLAGLAGLAQAVGFSGTRGVPAGAVTSSIDFGEGAVSTGPGAIYGGTSGFGGLSIPGGNVNAGGFETGAGAPGGGPLGALGTLSKIGGSLKGMLGQLGNLGISKGIGGATIQQGAGLGSHAIGGVAGGALLAGGAVLAIDGLRRGGVKGLLETTAGGAAIGAKFGGPVGALIGAGIGALAGTIRLFVKGKAEKIMEKVKSIYGIDITKSFAMNPLQQMIDQQYGGNIDVGLRAPDVRDLLQLYAQSTGQKFALADKPYAVGLGIHGGKLEQDATTLNGSRIAYGGGSLGVSGPVDQLITGRTAASNGVASSLTVQQLSLHINGASASAAMRGEIVNNPEAVAQAGYAATRSSINRRETAVAQSTPGLLLA